MSDRDGEAWENFLYLFKDLVKNLVDYPESYPIIPEELDALDLRQFVS